MFCCLVLLACFLSKLVYLLAQYFFLRFLYFWGMFQVFANMLYWEIFILPGVPSFGVRAFLIVAYRTLVFLLSLFFWTLPLLLSALFEFRQLLMFGLVGEELLLSVGSLISVVKHCPAEPLTVVQEGIIDSVRLQTSQIIPYLKHNHSLHSGTMGNFKGFNQMVYPSVQALHILGSGAWGKGPWILDTQEVAFDYFLASNCGRPFWGFPGLEFSSTFLATKHIGTVEVALSKELSFSDFVRPVGLKADIQNVLVNIIKDSDTVFNRFAITDVSEREAVQSMLFANYYKTHLEATIAGYPLVSEYIKKGSLTFVFSENLSGNDPLAVATNNFEHRKFLELSSVKGIFPTFKSKSITFVEFPLMCAALENLLEQRNFEVVEVASGALCKHRMGMKDFSLGFGDFGLTLISNGGATKDIILLDVKNYTGWVDVKDSISCVNQFLNSLRLLYSGLANTDSVNIKLALNVGPSLRLDDARELFDKAFVVAFPEKKVPELIFLSGHSLDLLFEARKR